MMMSDDDSGGGGGDDDSDDGGGVCMHLMTVLDGLEGRDDDRGDDDVR